jgi:hypothetical protein
MGWYLGLGRRRSGTPGAGNGAFNREIAILMLIVIESREVCTNQTKPLIQWCDWIDHIYSNVSFFIFSFELLGSRKSERDLTFRRGHGDLATWRLGEEKEGKGKGREGRRSEFTYSDLRRRKRLRELGQGFNGLPSIKSD